MQYFSFGTDFLAYSKQKKIPPTEGLFTCNLKAVLQGMVCKIWGWDECYVPHATLCLLHLIGGNHTTIRKRNRRHTTIRTERGA